MPENIELSKISDSLMNPMEDVVTTMPPLVIYVANKRNTYKWTRREMTWDEFCERTANTVRTTETMEEYLKLPKGQKDDIKDVGGFVMGRLKGGRRKKEFVQDRIALTLDMDYGKPDFDVAGWLDMLYGCCAVIYSTHRHTPEKPRYRIVIPFSRAVTPEEYMAVARMAAKQIGIELFDETTYETHRMMYWPSTSADGEFFYKKLEGEPLNPDSILAEYKDWHDVSSWPVSERQRKLDVREFKKQEDPLEKPGIIGAFCRAYYPVADAIAEFLSDVYQTCERSAGGLGVLGEVRYDYIPADSSAGVLIYDGKYVYSHHASDPACGQLLNAFDLVRIHKFGQADNKVLASSGGDVDDTTKLPSYKKMQEFAAELKEVKLVLAKEREERIRQDFEELPDEENDKENDKENADDSAGGDGTNHPTPPDSPDSNSPSGSSPADTSPTDVTPPNISPPDTSPADVTPPNISPPDTSSADTPEDDSEWQAELQVSKNGTIVPSLDNIVLILQHDKNLLPIAYNEHRDGIDIKGKRPWKQTKPGWNDTDLAALKVYLSRYYSVYAPTKTKEALMAVAAARSYHHIREYLNGLPAWDGVPRVETLLVTYLGAEDTPYTRAVTRKTLAAAIARIYEPGIKFDYVLIVAGPQGVGKSTLFARLGGKWFSDSLTLTDMKDKSGPEKMQGYWILELGELAGMKKAEVETVKSFVSRQDDKFRAAYGQNVEDHPRQCVIVGSTNSETGFLRDITGNRRFWPVTVTGESEKHTWQLDKATVEQVWAEAIQLYKQGEVLYLTGDEANSAEEKQDAAIEVDEREGLVRRFLEILLPEGWHHMNTFERREFLLEAMLEEEGAEGESYETTDRTDNNTAEKSSEVSSYTVTTDKTDRISAKKSPVELDGASAAATAEPVTTDKTDDGTKEKSSEVSSGTVTTDKTDNNMEETPSENTPIKSETTLFTPSSFKSENTPSSNRSENAPFTPSPFHPSGTKQGTIRRMTVSNIEIWTECFNKDATTMKKQDSYEISAIMKRIDGWERSDKRISQPLYGQQRVYYRVEE